MQNPSHPMKNLICLILLCLTTHLLMAQSGNVRLRIRYVPGIADIYANSYGDKKTKLADVLQLATLENYFDYSSIEAQTPGNVSEKALIFEYRFQFKTSQPRVHYLMSKARDPFQENDPLGLLWLGEGSHELDVYSVVENEESLNDKNYRPQYRLYYEGKYCNENHFLEQYAQASRKHQNEYQQLFNEIYNTYGVSDSSEVFRQELADKLTQRQAAYFASVDSTAQRLNALYKNSFPKPNPAFNAFVKPELQFFGSTFKLYFLVNLLAARNALGFGHPQPASVIQAANRIIAELDKQPVQLASSNYRNFYLTSVFLKNWEQAKDVRQQTSSNTDFSYTDFIYTLEEIVGRDFKSRATLREYLRAAIVDYCLVYLSYEDTEIANMALAEFAGKYPKNSYYTVLDKKLQQKEAELQANQKREKVYDYNSLDSTATTDVAPAIEAMVAPPEEQATEVKFWNYPLYDADSKIVKINNLRGKNLVIRALSSYDRIEDRDLAYFRFLEKKYKKMQFLYVVLGSPVKENTRRHQSFKLSGKILYIQPVSAADTVPVLTEEEIKSAPPPPKVISSMNETWYEWLQSPYWHLINKQGFMQRIYTSENLDEDSLQKWLQK